jgi:hypothetical protein
MRRAMSSNKAMSSGAAAGESEHNGVAIQRLKNKLGTKTVPTAELVLDGMRAWPIGDEGRGTKEIATILNITRVHTALSAMGLWGRGLAIGRAFARVRKMASGAKLTELPPHVRTLANNTVNYAAMMHLSFLTVAAMGVMEQPQAFESTPAEQRGVPFNSVAEAVAFTRLLAPVSKAVSSKYAIVGLQECMESLGGVGYLEDEPEYNVARLFRDVNVCAIWEGTTDVLAHDVVRVIKGRSGDEVRRIFRTWVEERTASWSNAWAAARELVRAELGKLEEQYQLSSEELAYVGRQIQGSIAWIVASVMLVEDALRDGNAVAAEIAKRWISQKAHGIKSEAFNWTESAKWDKLIAFPESEVRGTARL